MGFVANFIRFPAMQRVLKLVKIHIQGGPKLAQLLCTPQLYQMLIDFQNYFTVSIRRKFVIILSLKIPPHLKYVATLPCEMSSVLEATIENKTM